MLAMFQKTRFGIHPSCEDSNKLFKKIPDQSLVKIEWVKKRNYENHKRFMAFRDVTFGMQDSFHNDEVWRQQLLLMAGHFELVLTPLPEKWKLVLNYLNNYLKGPNSVKVIEIIEKSFKTQYMVKSMSYEKMDEIEFNEMFDRAIDGFIKYYGNGISKDDFLRVIQFD